MKRLLIAAAASCLVAAGIVYAQVADEVSDERAVVLATGCFSCHGVDGRSPGPIPPIAGLPAETTIALFQAFQADEVPGTTVMGRIARGYTEAEIAAIARYFAAIEP